MEMIRQIAGPVLKPIGTFAMVMLFVIFILIERQDLRDRFIHLVGRGRLYVTTQALDEAAGKVSRYLFAQLTVNVTYGIPIAIGLYFIGIPNAALWGLLTILLRFIPYLGPWMGAFFPTLLSFAITPGWTPLVLTVGLFVTMELISNNVVEPWLYGTSTGLSPMAVIVSAVFWTWIWGIGGLLLATPLTVCVAVLGKYVADLAFLDVLLGSRPPIAPEHRYYQRLLAADDIELFEIVEGYADRDAVPELFDRVILPALTLAEHDRAAGIITREEQEEVYRSLRESLECVDGLVAEPHGEPGCFVIVPARTEADEIAGLMLAHLLEKQGCRGCVVSHRALRSEILEILQGSSTRCLCVSAVTRVSARVGELLLRRIGSAATHSVLGLWWGGAASKGAAMEHVRVVRTIEEASHYIAERAFLKAAAEVEQADGQVLGT